MASPGIVRPSELLAELGRDYRRVQQNHAREPRESAGRRRMEAEMGRIARRFERALAFWVARDDALQSAWRKYLYDDGPMPGGPSIDPPPLFRGETETGSRLEIRPAPDGGCDLFTDGARVEHQAVPWSFDPGAGGSVSVGQFVCRELFEAPAEAVRELARFAANPGAGNEPPWRYARELFADGLIDGEFALTRRGRRLLSRAPAEPSPLPGSFCV